MALNKACISVSMTALICIQHGVYRICVDIWTKKELPKDWTKLVLVPVPKPGNKQDCNNYRHISLICHAGRILLNIILNRLTQYSERELPEEQTGFRAGKGTRDALFVLQLVIEKTIDTADKELYLTFISYRKAFDIGESRNAL